MLDYVKPNKKCLTVETLIVSPDKIKVNENIHPKEEHVGIMDREIKRKKSNTNSEGPLERQART